MKRIAALVLLAALAACARPRPGAPPELRFGRTECARCGMIVSEERFACGWIGDDGGSVGFDDVGEMLAALEETPALRSRAWVRDMKGGGWVRLEEAHLRRIEGLATPMGTGWVAFARVEDLEAFVKSRRRQT
ncbi:MAG: hypothetical protein HY553_07580 [Elusimicrobia bacterium]|nr:hypothetical protein [Elusimicrobiota bacterium]